MVLFVQEEETVKSLSVLVLLVGLAGSAFAGISAPEIDANSASAAIALVSGSLLVLRGRRKQ